MNERELASLIWLVAVVATAVLNPKVRPALLESTKQFLQALASRPIPLLLGAYIVWCAGWVAVAAALGLWNWSLALETALIFMSVCLPLITSATKSRSGPELLRHVARQTIAISALVAVYVNLFPLPLWAELLLLPIVVGLSFKAEQGRRGRAAAASARRAQLWLSLMGLGLLTWTALQFVALAEELDSANLLRQLLLSIWLPAIALPFLYPLAFFSTVETHLKRLVYSNPGMPHRAQLAFVLGLHGSLRLAAKFIADRSGVGAERTFAGAKRAMADFRSELDRRERLETERLDRLRDFAGETGTDGTGAQLDRRQFHETKGALRFVHTAQMTRFKGQGERFWDDLTDMVLSGPSLHGLPRDHGVSVETTADGKRWRAWRRMPSGWVLGIGEPTPSASTATPGRSRRPTGLSTTTLIGSTRCATWDRSIGTETTRRKPEWQRVDCAVPRRA
ncbi:hypothetical protein [Agrococcus sediminis]|uniref:hypothetical protein n=1 Tax=Agrococcus sediminis TaxID=2599924 RepID=UPI00344826C2